MNGDQNATKTEQGAPQQAAAGPQPGQEVAQRPAVRVGLPTMALSPENIEGQWRLSEALAIARWLPRSYTERRERGQTVQYDHKEVIGNIFLAIQMGAEVGLKPMQAIRSIAMINFVPYMWGDAPGGIVRRSGVEEYTHEWWDGDPLNPQTLTAHCETKRKGHEPVHRTFSWAQAQLAGLAPDPSTKQEGKDTYVKYGMRMLQMRARHWAHRDAFPDVLMGLALYEEAVPMIDVTPPGEGLSLAAPAPRPRREDYPESISDSVDSANGAGTKPAAPAKAAGEPVGAAEPEPMPDTGKEPMPTIGVPIGAGGASPPQTPAPLTWTIIDHEGEIVGETRMPAVAVNHLQRAFARTTNAMELNGALEVNLDAITKLPQPDQDEVDRTYNERLEQFRSADRAAKAKRAYDKLERERP